MIKEFWETKHMENSLPSLSGHPWPTIRAGLYLRELDVFKKNVLEVGVGLAICSKELYARGANLSCVDISKNALLRVADFATTYKAETIHLLPEEFFDLAISYCVTQHINDDSLQKQLNAVVKALKADGIFAMQYAFPTYGNSFEEGYHAMASGSVCRPLEKMYDMVGVAGGRIVYHRIFGIYPQYKSGWAVIHIMKE